jgi:hypothetical protein
MFTGPNIVTDGLVLHLDAANTKSYPGSGTTWYDKSGNGNNGTLANGPTFNTGSGGSMVFDGVNDYIDTGYDLSWNNTNSVSVSIMLTPTILQNRGFIGKGPTNWEWQLNQKGANLELVYWNSGGSHSNGPVTTIVNVFDVNIPVSIVLVWSHTDNKHYFYKNGVNVGENTWIDASINQNRTTSVNIGGAIYAWSLGGAYWVGMVHNLSLYNRALSAQEILQNYNATKSRFNL